MEEKKTLVRLPQDRYDEVDKDHSKLLIMVRHTVCGHFIVCCYVFLTDDLQSKWLKCL